MSWKVHAVSTYLTHLTSYLFNCLAHSFQNHIGNMWFCADWSCVPDKFVVALGRISPCRLVIGKAFLYLSLGFAEQDRDVLLRVHAVADEERHDDDVFRAREFVAISDARLFFEEHGMDRGIFVGRADNFDLALDGFAGIFILLRAVTGDEQSGFLRVRRARKWKLGGDFAGAKEQHTRHALVRADGFAKTKFRVSGFDFRVAGQESQFAGDHIAAEIAFADEERDDEYFGFRNIREHGFDLGFLLPESLAHLGEKIASPQFRRVLIDRRRRIVVLGRAMAENDERRI